MRKIIKLLVYFALAFSCLYTLVSIISKVNQSSKFTEKPTNEYCLRVEPYPIPEQLKRSLSLVTERYSNMNIEWIREIGSDYTKMSNCLYISFSNLTSEGAEGVFLFDEVNSTPERLVILVDSNYKDLDDLSSAILLSHELSHSRQFIREYLGGAKLDCVQSEIEAYAHQTLFATTFLTAEEKNSLLARLERNSTSSNQVIFFEQLINWGYDSTKACTNANDKEQCLLDGLVKNIRNWVISQSAYQEQCGI
jgi:hypothetical protein